MKRIKIKQKIAFHYQQKKYAKILREVDKDFIESSHGYIIDFSKDFIVVMISNDFDLSGFEIIPIKQIKRIRCNHYDKYYHKIMKWEGLLDNI